VIVLGLSILGSVFSLGGNILIAHKKRSGWLWWIAGNGAWIAVNFLGQMNVPMVLMYVAYFIINVTGYREWYKEADIIKNIKRRNEKWSTKT
jgi:nicotinamide riboside transporter PnuC